MRNLLKRRPRDEAKPTLLERFAATKAKAGTVLLRRQPVTPELADRTAMVCYSTWLNLERRRVCQELYPHLGNRGTAFTLGYNAGEDWHFNRPNRMGGYADRGPVSARAVRVLDFIGVDWRGDQAKGLGPDDIARDLTKDTGERPAKPYGWPAVDTELVTAAGDLSRIDAAITVLIKGDERDVDEIPGYEALDETRDEALTTLMRERAEGLPGLQAKARALIAPSLDGDPAWKSDIGRSLARDLLRANGRTIEPQADPILAVIEEAWRLTREHGRLLDICAGEPDSHPSRPPEREAHAAMWRHIRDVLLDTIPRTAEGCRALARFAFAFEADQGVEPHDEGENSVLDLIAQSPLL